MMENKDMKMGGEGKMMMGGKMCGCTCHKALPILVILFGLDFLLAVLGVFTWGFVDVTWPILVIIAGIVKLCKGSCGCMMKHGEMGKTM